MKLQSQKTMRFDTAELQRLARLTRPTKQRPILVWIAAGLWLGIGIVIFIRACGL